MLPAAGAAAAVVVSELVEVLGEVAAAFWSAVPVVLVALLAEGEAAVWSALVELVELEALIELLSELDGVAAAFPAAAPAAAPAAGAALVSEVLDGAALLALVAL